MTRRWLLSLILSTASTAALPAWAQTETATATDDEPGRPRRYTPEEIRARTSARTASREAGETNTTAAGKDHDTVIGHFGVGWFGVSNILVDFSLDGSASGVVAAPILGVRYWMSETLGIDAGVGIAITGSSAAVEAAGMTTESDGPATFGLLLHGGLPIAFKTGQHYTFTLIPEINLGFASVTREVVQGGMTTTTIENSGFRLDLGGRAGAEVQFGFIGIPELALEASVGLYLTRVQAREEQNGVIQRVGQTSITTTALNSPWDFFRSTVAARYYF